MGEIDGHCFRDDSAKNRGKEFVEGTLSTPKVGQGKPSPHDGKGGENHERGRHGLRRLVDVLLYFARYAREAKEGQKEQSENVKGGQACGHHADYPEKEVAIAAGDTRERVRENFVFAEEPSERGY